MKYLITGSTGLVGNELVNQLSQTNNTIYCTIHKTKPNTNINRVQYIFVDITNQKSFNTIPKNVDIIIHSAALINGNSTEHYILNNYAGTKNLVHFALDNNVKKFVYISSWSTALNGGSYSLSKLLAEQAVRKISNHLIIKPADIFSLNKSHIHTYIKSLFSYPFIPVIGSGDYYVSPLYVVDLVKSIFSCMKTDTHVTTITGPKIYTFNEFNLLISKYYQKQKVSIHIPLKPLKLVSKLEKYLPFKFPFDEERLNRLSGNKVIVNRFNFKKNGIEPLYFDKAIKKILL